MTTTTVSPATFAREAQRRLIDTHELAELLGLRQQATVWERVRAGTLPQPVLTRHKAISLWDRDALNLPDRKA